MEKKRNKNNLGLPIGLNSKLPRFLGVLVSVSAICLIGSTFALIYPDNFNEYVKAFSSNVYEEKITTQSTNPNRLISVRYQAVNTPKSAKIDVMAYPDNQLVYSASQVDLSQRLSYSFNVDLPGGDYILRVSAPTTQTQTVTFSIDSNRDSILVNLGTFNLLGADYLGVEDINQDGVINTLDMQALLMGVN